MTRVDTDVPARVAPHAGVQREAVAADRARVFARCLSAAEHRAACDAPSQVDPPDTQTAPIATQVEPIPAEADPIATRGEPSAGVAVVPPGGTPVATPQVGDGDVPVDPRGAAAVRMPVRQTEPGSIRERFRSGERTGDDDPASVSFETARAPSGAAHVGAPPPASAPGTDAAALARAMLQQLPWPGGSDRTLTVSFPAGGGAVEQIVVTVSGGVVAVVVTARAQQRERVAAALPELARLMRARGIRVGEVGLG
jgi:hypothetical protein